MQGYIKKLVDNDLNIFPVTVADAVYVENNKNLKQKFEELRSGIEGNTGAYVIELDRWGIIEGSQGKPPYTLEQWEIGYNNILGFNKALAWANNLGLGTVIVPRGTYSFCYTNFSGVADNAMFRNIPLTLFSNQVFDLNGSTFNVMYDSINKNPYDLSPETNPAWKLNGRLVCVEDCYNTHIINGTIIGDIPNRSFTDTGTGFNSEKGMEQTYGIFFDRSSYCSAENIDSSMFMGDGICVGAQPKGGAVAANIVTSTTCAPGFVNTDGTISTTVAGAYLSPSFKIDPKKMPIIQMRTGGGYTRIPEIVDKQFYYVFFDATGKYIGKKQAVYLQRITVPYNTDTVRVQFTNEAVGLTSLTSISYAVGTPQNNNIKISSCILHDNHRGGLSGGADYTLIEYCQFYRNGEDSGIGVPLFPDTTRYAIDFEDSYANYVVLENNEFSNGFNGVLLGVYHARVVGNFFNNISGVVVYNNANIVISNNMFYQAGVGLMTSNDTQERNVIISNNTFYQPLNGLNLDTTTHVETRIKFDNNTVYADGGQFIGNIEMTNNYFKSYSSTKYTNHVNMRLEPTKMIGNTFEDFPSGTGYSHRLSLSKKVGSSQIIKDNIFIGCTFSSVTVDNDSEFIDSQFFNCDWSNPPKDITKSSSVTFNNCELTDTSINLGGTYTNNLTQGGVVIKAVFNNCKILLTESFPKLMFVSVAENKSSTEQINAGVAVPRKYECVINNSTFDNKIASKSTYMFKYNTPGASDIDQNKTVKIKNSTVTLADATKFSLVMQNYASNMAIINDTEYVGFTSFFAPTGDKLQTTKKAIIVKSDTAPTNDKDITCWFNTTVNKAYWWTGTEWVDAMGGAL